jgi:hypothetical protein
VLPQRGITRPEGGVLVRYVFPESAAAVAGVQAGDRVLRLNGQHATSAEALRLAVANQTVGVELTLAIKRGEEELELHTRLGPLPTAVPDVPPARDPPIEPAAPPDRPAANGVMEIQVPGEPNACFAYVPPVRSAESWGILVHLLPPGSNDRETLLRDWSPLCDAQQLILIAPQSQDPQRWLETEVDFVRQTIDRVRGEHPVDPTRIAVFGSRSAGSMAYLVAFRLPELVRGLAVVDAAMPLRTRPPETDPVRPLAWFVVLSRQSPLSDRIRGNVEMLKEMKHNVIIRELEDGPRDLDQTERAELVRWLDTLDRI